MCRVAPSPPPDLVLTSKPSKTREVVGISGRRLLAGVDRADLRAEQLAAKLRELRIDLAAWEFSWFNLEPLSRFGVLPLEVWEQIAGWLIDRLDALEKVMDLSIWLGVAQLHKFEACC
jgi:hypothetical protein